MHADGYVTVTATNRSSAAFGFWTIVRVRRLWVFVKSLSKLGIKKQEKYMKKTRIYANIWCYRKSALRKQMQEDT